MNSSSRIQQIILVVVTTFFLQAVGSPVALAQSSGVRFQRPGAANEQSEQVKKQFRRPGTESETKSQPRQTQTAQPKVVRETTSAKQKRTVVKRSEAKQVSAERAIAERERDALERDAKPLRQAKATKPKVTPVKVARRDRRVAVASDGPVAYQPVMESALELSSYGCDVCDGPCTCEIGCGCPEPSCGMYEPGCGMVEPSCGCGEPSCGICEPSCGVYEPGCGMVEPSCGCGQVDCGSCCARPGPDYWCFPVCLPRFKDLSVWAGVQSWGSPSNVLENGFGFNQGINVSGRAPLVGLLFPQLSYQLGYQGVQSRFEGSNGVIGAGIAGDRSQQFVTAGLFRRVNTGVQFGAVWDYLDDDGLLGPGQASLQQVRTEISLKSPQGREIGFMSAIGTDSTPLGGLTLEAVDQYAIFYRWHFGHGYESRLWGGATNDGDGLFGGEFYAPFNDRWALQAGFNYLKPEDLPTANNIGLDLEESWNVGINIVWHLGKTAKRGACGPHRPLFRTADNGSFMVDLE